jgi:3-oxoacyl-[acyl-carrier protein] reductase
MFDFNGKVVVITGANGGIGTATTEAFLRQGAKVVGCDFAYPPVDDPVSVIRADNPAKVHMDVTKKAQVTAVIQAVVQAAGKLDVVVNAAGILRSKAFTEITEEEWDTMLDINLRGQFFVCQEALKVMMEQKAGCFVNIASFSGEAGGIMAAVDYSASKAGVICLTKCLAKTGAAYGVRANSVAPGGVDTKMLDVYKAVWGEEHVTEVSHMNPMGRWGRPEEVASGVLFLASDEASFVTGACLDINGGILMNP